MATILASSSQLVEATSATPSWQEAVQRAFRDSQSLLTALGLQAELATKEESGSENASETQKLRSAEEQFPVFVPLEFASRMRPGDPKDPLLRQVLSTPTEGELFPGFSSDPVGDLTAERLPGLLKKYSGRALLVTTGSCAVHCRYCFRREFPYPDVPKSPRAWKPALDMIAQDESLREVVLSGGDPLMLSDSSLEWLVEHINGIPHIARLRIHSRVPVVIPQRVCDALLAWVAASRMQVVFVLHINHAREIDRHVVSAMHRLRAAGVMLLNQSVLLRGVNDSVQDLLELSEQLLAAGVLPYYLHQLDRVQGAAHFEVPVAEGLELISKLRALISGYAVPKYVSEVAGEASKRPLESQLS